MYNTLHDLGKSVSLSKIIYDTERNNDMLWHGWFGTKASKVDDILRMYGVESTDKIQNVDFMDELSRAGKIADGQIYVATACNGAGDFFSGIHTFEIVYSPSQNPENPWIVYNLDVVNPEPSSKATFREIFSGRPLHIHKIEIG